MKFNSQEKHLSRVRVLQPLAATVLVGVLLLVVGLTLAVQADSVSPVTETLDVPFTGYTPMMTAGDYSGEVLVIVSGTGQASGVDYTDAFYRFTGGDVLLEIPVEANEFGLEIDGNLAPEALGFTPKYASDHVYVFTYDVGNEPRPIGFRIAEGALADNTGAFVVRIVPSH
ncbi:MAG: hypothetical protein H7175_08900 [Burkholderiales bacterium]|nr:hypothetical protein [Anaerolineae bacterium]